MLLLKTGVDDATKCPCIGSIFITIVCADSNIIRMWKKAGVTDSKKITRKKREKLSFLIRKTALFYQVDQVTPEKIDDKRFNLNEWEMITVLNLIGQMPQKLRRSTIYIDNWEVSEAKFWERIKILSDKQSVLKKLDFDLPFDALEDMKFRPEHQSDQKHIIVGAASILSKNYSDRQYDSYRKTYGDFGSGNPGDLKTRKFIWKHRKSPPRIIRRSWKTFADLLSFEKFPH